jgi:hypothetical protein
VTIEHKHYLDQHGQDMPVNPQLELDSGPGGQTRQSGNHKAATAHAQGKLIILAAPPALLEP